MKFHFHHELSALPVTVLIYPQGTHEVSSDEIMITLIREPFHSVRLRSFPFLQADLI
jgi:hypothetical protein